MLSDHYSSPLPSSPKSMRGSPARNFPGYFEQRAPGRAYTAISETDDLLSSFTTARADYESTWNVGPLRRAPLHTINLPPTLSQEMQLASSRRHSFKDASSAQFEHPLQDVWSAEHLLLRREGKPRGRQGSKQQRGPRLTPTRVLGRSDTTEAGSTSELRRVASVFAPSMHLGTTPSTPSRPPSSTSQHALPTITPAVSKLSLLADLEHDGRPRPRAGGSGTMRLSCSAASLRTPPRVLAPVMMSTASRAAEAECQRRMAELELERIVLP